MVGFKMCTRKVICAHSKDFAFGVLLGVRGAALVDGEGGRELLQPDRDVEQEGGNFFSILVAPSPITMSCFIVQGLSKSD